jgi:hypothetical protein
VFSHHLHTLLFHAAFMRLYLAVVRFVEAPAVKQDDILGCLQQAGPPDKRASVPHTELSSVFYVCIMCLLHKNLTPVSASATMIKQH